MDSDAEMMARHSAMLAELAAWSHELAGDLRERALAAEAPAERAALGRAFHDVARSVRQCVALEIRVRRDIRRLERETQANAAPLRLAEVKRRMASARKALNDLIWREYEDVEDLDVDEMIGEIVEDAAGEDGFATDPLETVVGRLEGFVREQMDKYAVERAAEQAEEEAEAQAAEVERASADAAARADPWAGGDRHDGWRREAPA